MCVLAPSSLGASQSQGLLPVVFECWVEYATSVSLTSDAISEEDALGVGTLVVRVHS